MDKRGLTPASVPVPVPAPVPPVRADRQRDLRIARILFTLIGAVLIGMGAVSLGTSHYHGSSNKLGGAQVSLDGTAALAAGCGLIGLGLLPLAVWMPGPRWVVAWAVLSVAISAAGFWFSAHPQSL